MNRFAQACLIAVFMLFAVSLGTCVYWMMESAGPASVVHQSKTVDQLGREKPAFKPGEVMYVWRDVTVLKAVPRVANQFIVNDTTKAIVIRYAAAASPNRLGREQRSYAVPLPEYIPPGRYTYHVTLWYPLNPIRRDETYSLPPVQFTVE